jgi:hypothetical protein
MRAFVTATCIVVGLLGLGSPVVRSETALGTAFTYQGSLKQSGTAVTGTADFVFSLWDAALNGAQVGSTVAMGSVPVQGGLFLVNLDFGAAALAGNARWLQISVRYPAGSGLYTILSRQPLYATPYATYALHSPGSGLWQANGTSVFNTNSGFVGIGVNPPLARLHVQSDDLGLLSTAIYGDELVIEDEDAVLGLYSTGGGTVGSTIGLAEVNAGALVDKWSLYRTTSGVTPASQLRFSFGTSTNYTTNTTVLALSGDGNVGVGTTSPVAKLEVSGTEMAFRVDGDSIMTGDLRVGLGVTPDPDATINVQGGTDVALSGGGFVVVGGKTSSNLALDTNEIQARNDGAAATLYLNHEGGAVSIGGATTVKGNVTVRSASTNAVLVELGEGLDYAEGFNTKDKSATPAGSVMVIDASHPGQLALSTEAYDKRVAGIVAGAKGLGSAVRLGAGQFDVDVALAGRVYCYVDATETAVEPGDLLTTSATPGHAMKATDTQRATGAVLGKAMEPLKKGEKGQILVLVTLQ